MCGSGLQFRGCLEFGVKAVLLGRQSVNLGAELCRCRLAGLPLATEKGEALFQCRDFAREYAAPIFQFGLRGRKAAFGGRPRLFEPGHGLL